MTSPKPTIHDVATRAGVSVSTVSRVLNGETRYIREVTRQAVEQAIADLAYHPNRQAKAVRGGRTYVIGLILSDIANPFWPAFARGVQRVARREGYQVVLSNSDWDHAIELEYLAMAERARFDGIIINPGEVTNADLKHTAIPTVVCGRDSGFSDFDVVSGDGGSATRQAIDHLVQLGHRRIGFVGFPSRTAEGPVRRAEFGDSLERHGITSDPVLVVEAPYEQAGGQEAARHLLSLTDPPTAIVTSNDLQAIGVLAEADRRGLAVPQDLSLIGRDDIELASVTSPQLTTIRIDRELLGETSMHLLIERIEQTGPPSFRQKRLPMTLEIRGTTAVPKDSSGSEVRGRG